MREIRLIVDPPAPGPQNMAVDEVLLVDAVENGLATLRFYTWSEPTLSLGYFQRFDDRYTHPASRDCAIVRRQTGGGAILHDRELTYSLSLPGSDQLAHHTQQLYTTVHDAFIAALAPHLATGNLPWRLARHERTFRPNTALEPFLCFQRRARGDVLLLRDSTGDASQLPWPTQSSQGTKILGSAQRRHRGAVLQHGSLLQEKSPHAPELAGWRDVTGIDVSIAEVISFLTVRLTEVLNARLSEAQILSCELQSNSAELANTKYGSAAWTKRR